MGTIINCVAYCDGQRVESVDIDRISEVLQQVDRFISLMSLAQNEVMKRFAGWGAIVALPTMIAGNYGMNFAFMPELSWPYSYPLILTLTVGLCTFLYIRFRRAS